MSGVKFGVWFVDDSMLIVGGIVAVDSRVIALGVAGDDPRVIVEGMDIDDPRVIVDWVNRTLSVPSSLSLPILLIFRGGKMNGCWGGFLGNALLWSSVPLWLSWLSVPSSTVGVSPLFAIVSAVDVSPVGCSVCDFSSWGGKPSSSWLEQDASFLKQVFMFWAFFVSLRRMTCEERIVVWWLTIGFSLFFAVGFFGGPNLNVLAVGWV